MNTPLEFISTVSLISVASATLVSIITFLLQYRKRKKHIQVNMELREDTIMMGGASIGAGDRREIIKNHKALYGVHNTGVSLDDRQLYSLSYNEIGF